MIKIDWQKVGGMLPVIAQASDTSEVLMFAFMNEEALNLTLTTGFAHYFSRTKNRIWKKGEESGNVQKIDEIYLDCDNDTLLLKITQIGGAACHTGERSCFFRRVEFGGELEAANLTQAQNLTEQNLEPNANAKKPSYGIIDEVYHVILERKFNADPDKSYVASLFKKGENAILKKVGEEATELVMACKDTSAAYAQYVAAKEKYALLDKNQELDSGTSQSDTDAQNLDKDNEPIDLAGALGDTPQFVKKAVDNITDKHAPNIQKAFDNMLDFINELHVVTSKYEYEKAQNDLVYEAADLCFHALIALAAHGIHPERVKDELARRFGLSGIEEKNARNDK